MTVLSKTAAGLSIFSCIKDMHTSAVLCSRNKAAKFESNALIARSLGAQKTNYLSKKDANGKNWILLNENFSIGVKKAIGSITGYIKGFFQSGIRYIPNFIASACAIFFHNERHANMAAGALGIIELWNFIKNSTNIFERTDYLK